MTPLSFSSSSVGNHATLPVEVLDILRRGGLGVLPTDTLYGIVTSALDVRAVERLYALRKRDQNKPVIILIADEQELGHFSVFPDERIRSFLKCYWPGTVSVVLPAPDKKWRHLDRGTGTLAFRVPGDSKLRAFLKQSGPLVAPSANISGMPPATTIDEARRYFGDCVDFYVDDGKREGPPSTLISFDTKGVRILRPGSVDVEQIYANRPFV